MEMVAGAASVTQLVAYSFSSIRYLQRLYNELKAHGSSYRDEETNLRLLLDVIRGLCQKGVKDNDPILPILVDLTGLACDILHLLQPRKLLGFDWAPWTRQDELRSAFAALDRKQKLLHLHVSRTNGEALAALRLTLDKKQTGDIGTVLQTMDTSFKKFSFKRVTIAGYSEVLSGHQSLPPEFEVEDFEVSSGGVNLFANKEHAATGAQIKEMARGQEARKTRSTGTTQPQAQQQKVAVHAVADGSDLTAAMPTIERLAARAPDTVAFRQTPTVTQTQLTWSSPTAEATLFTAHGVPRTRVRQQKQRYSVTSRELDRPSPDYVSSSASSTRINESEDETQKQSTEEAKVRVLHGVSKKNGILLQKRKKKK